LCDRLEFVIVTAGALQRETEKRGTKNLHIAFKHGVLVHLHFEWIPITLARAIRRIAPKMCGDERVNPFLRDITTTRVTDKLIAGDLFLDETVEWFVRIDRTNDVIAKLP